MKIEQSTVKKIHLTDINSTHKLDPVTVLIEDFKPGQGKVIIECYGKAWCIYWSSTGDTISEFFQRCDEHYLANKLSDINSEVIDINQVIKDGKEKGILNVHDEVEHDHGLLHEIYGDDLYDDGLPMKANPDYTYLCRIIKTVQEALKTVDENA